MEDYYPLLTPLMEDDYPLLTALMEDDYPLLTALMGTLVTADGHSDDL